MKTTLAIAFLIGLAFASSLRAQVAAGEIEKRQGFVASTAKESANMLFVTLSETEADGPVRVGYLMQIPAGSKPPLVKGPASVEYKGHEYLRLTMKDGSIHQFSNSAAGLDRAIKHVVVTGFQRLGFKADAYPNHAVTATAIFELFKEFPKPRGRDGQHSLQQIR